jgi:hypothetical protein
VLSDGHPSGSRSNHVGPTVRRCGEGHLIYLGLLTNGTFSFLRPGIDSERSER